MAELEDTVGTSPPDPQGPDGEIGLPLEQCRDLFVVLGKAFRAYQLYDENNPVRHRFIESLRQAFQDLWTELDGLTLTVEEDRLLLEGEEVYQTEARGDSLAFLFYKDGVREITFIPGLESEELESFLGVLQRARKLRPEGDDLLTVLWEQDLQYFQYQYVDFLAEGVGLPVPGGGNTEAELANVVRSETEELEGEEEEASASGERATEAVAETVQTVSREDFNPTLYALDPREMAAVATEIEKELSRDVRSDVLSALFDRLEEPENRGRQSEILGILRTLLPGFLSRGLLADATRALEELRKLEAMPGIFDEERLAESRGLLDEVSSPEAIEELIQALYDGSIRATPQQLATFLRFLRAGALSPLLRASETVDHKELKAVLRAAVRGIAERNRGAVVRLMENDDAILASGAARIAGDLQIEEAGPALAGLLAHRHPDVRLAAVEAAVTLKASTAAGALQHTLNDPERDVRIAAAKALGTLHYRPAARRLAEIVSSKEIRSADISEKVAFFEAYGMVAEAGAVAMLDRLLNAKKFLRKREPSEIRAAAALGLGKVPGEDARSSLMKASNEEDPVVRTAVNRALRNEE
ncbi:MAG: HEAT repeat domain-containing protein [Gemmatimonadetes bacterium]|nr:HEAT repeat domain-containing protein [Gemmatimonadota bacterium]